MRFILNNNVLTQSIIFLPVISKYVLSRIKNIFPIRKNKAMIRIFAEAFDFGNIFSKSKINIDVEVVKKGLLFAAIRYVGLTFYLLLMLRTCAVETVKSCSLFLLLVNLCIPDGHCFGRNSLPTSYQHTQLKLSASLQ